MNELDELIDGKKYWLGACWGKYNKESDCFMLGNCFVDRWKTIYKDKDAIYNEYGFQINLT